MDPPTELPLNATREELAVGKINWLPGEKKRRRKEEEKGGGAGGMKKGVKELVKLTGREVWRREDRGTSETRAEETQFRVSSRKTHKQLSVIKDG